LQPVTAGEWAVILRRQSVELTYREASFELDLSINRVCQLSSPRLGVLKKSRRGFVTSKSVKNYILKLQKKESHEHY